MAEIVVFIGLGDVGIQGPLDKTQSMAFAQVASHQQLPFFTCLSL